MGVTGWFYGRRKMKQAVSAKRKNRKNPYAGEPDSDRLEYEVALLWQVWPWKDCHADADR
jgi:hypothetical protein